MSSIRRAGALLAALFACLTAALFLLPRTLSARAETAGPYDFDVTAYDVEMEIARDRSISVKQTISVSFTGFAAHGIVYDFPLSGGVRYENVEARCSDADFSPYFQTDAVDFLSLYLRGEGRVAGQSRVYTLSYSMLVPALAEEGYLPLDVVGYGWQAPLRNVTVKVTFPDGLLAYNLYSGRAGSTENAENVSIERQGNALLLRADELSRYSNRGDGGVLSSGVTLDLRFAEGVLGEPNDPSLLYALLFGAGLIAAALLVKFLFCRAPLTVRAVNLSAPGEMDPLTMGKLIDDTIDREDLGSLVFYLADKGYLSVDFSQGEEDPRLLKMESADPSVLPDHVRVFYEGLFEGSNAPRVSQLTNRFYRTADRVRILAAKGTGRTFRPFSRVLVYLFGVLACLLLGGFAFLYARNFVGGYGFYYPFVACAISYLIPAIASAQAKKREFKQKASLRVCTVLFGTALGLLPALGYLLLPCAAFGVWTGVLLAAFASLCGAISGFFLTRDKEHAVRLGQILGFRQFLLFTEKDRIAFMLKDDPELYYRILPYAQVLGVTDAWTEKFEGLSLAPPAYLTGYPGGLFDFLVFRGTFNALCVSMTSAMFSRPSSAGSGVGRGGFGGGFGGGGFGGGGGRGC